MGGTAGGAGDAGTGGLFEPTDPIDMGLFARFSFDEGEGTSIWDSVSGIQGTLVGGAQFTDQTPLPGYALQLVQSSLSTADEYVLLGATTPFWTLELPFSIAVWIRLERPTADLAPIITACDRLREYCGFRLSVTPDLRAEAWVGGGIANETGRQNCAGGTVPVGEWTHLATVVQKVDGYLDMRVFLNGAEQSTQCEGTGRIMLWAAGRAVVGGRLYGDRGFPGAIDELRVYGRTLETAEIQQLATPPPDGQLESQST